jgi:hypothetical protein
MDIDDEEDPVVRTVDVFLSQNLPGTRDASGRSDGLFVFQYPLRPKWYPLDCGWKLESTKYRPYNQMVEMDFSSEFRDGSGFRHKLASSTVPAKSTCKILFTI